MVFLTTYDYVVKGLGPIFSDAYTTADLFYTWRKDPGVTILDNTMAQFVISRFTTQTKTFDYVAGKVQSSLPNELVYDYLLLSIFEYIGRAWLAQL